MEKVKNIKKVWEVPEIKSLSIKTDTKSGTILPDFEGPFNIVFYGTS